MATNSRTQLIKLAISVGSVAAVAGITGLLSNAAQGEEPAPFTEQTAATEAAALPTAPERARGRADGTTGSGRTGTAPRWERRTGDDGGDWDDGHDDHDDDHDDDDEWGDDERDGRWELLFESGGRTGDAQRAPESSTRRTRTRHS